MACVCVGPGEQAWVQPSAGPCTQGAGLYLWLLKEPLPEGEMATELRSGSRAWPKGLPGKKNNNTVLTMDRSIFLMCAAQTDFRNEYDLCSLGPSETVRFFFNFFFFFGGEGLL